MAGLRSTRKESGLSDEDSSDENYVPAVRRYRTSVRHKDTQKKEQEQLRLAVEEMTGRMKMIMKGFNRLQSPTASRNIDEDPMPINARTRTQENSERMERGEHFSLDNNEDYEKVHALVNTLNKLVTRVDTLNHRLERGKIYLCAHPCCHAHTKDRSDSAGCTNIQELENDSEPSGIQSTNHGTHAIIKEAVDIHMTDENVHNVPPKFKCDPIMLESYQLLQSEQLHGSEEHNIPAAVIDKLAGRSQNNDKDQPTIVKKVNNDQKQMDIRGIRKKIDISSERRSSVQFIRIDSSGLKSVNTDPQEDNRKKTVKEDFQNNSSAKFYIEQNNDPTPSHKPKLKKNEDVQYKGHTKYSNRTTKEMIPSSKIVKTEDTMKTKSNFAKSERTTDKNRQRHVVGTISRPVVSHTAKAVRKTNAPFPVSSFLPPEYWDSFIQETFDKAKIIKTSRSIGFDTIICLDTSMSMAEYWDDILDFLKNLINEIEMAQPMEEGLMEHIAVVTFGHETCVLEHFTTNYQEVLRKLHLINPEGSTPLFWAIQLCVAILFGSAFAPRRREFRLAPRLLLVTDGRPTYRLITGGPDEPVKYDEELEKGDVSAQLIITTRDIPLLRVYPVAVGNNCDMEFLTAISNSCGGKVMTLSDWSTMAKYGNKMVLASKYFGLASLSQDLLPKVLRETSGLPQEDVEFVTTAVKDHLEYQNNEGTTSDEEEVEGSYQLPPVGSRVRRGPDWNRNDEDNVGPGTIIGYSKGKAHSGRVIVVWDNPKKYCRDRLRYRYGAEDAYDVKIQEREGPRVMESSWIMKIGCEVVRGNYRKSSDDGIETGTIGMVYDTNMDGKNEAKIRWNNGKRGIYSGQALNSGEIELSPRSRPYYERWPFDPLQLLRNPLPSSTQPNIDDSRRQPPRKGALCPSQGQSSTRELQNPSVSDNESSDSDVTGKREALIIENVERCGMPSVDDMNIRNQIHTRKEETRNKETFGGTRNSSYSKKSSGSREAMKSDIHAFTQETQSDVNTKRPMIKRRNKNAEC